MLQRSSRSLLAFATASTLACMLLGACVTHSATPASRNTKDAPPAMTSEKANANASSNASSSEASKTRPMIMQTMNIYDGQLTYPAPHWVSSPKELGNFKASREQTKNSFTFEQIPKNQDFQSWTMLYGVYGWNLPDYDFKRFIAESLNALALGCKVQATSKLVSAESGNVVMTYHCPDLVDPLVKNGNDTESGFLFMSHVGSSYVKVYQAWRASNKDRDTPAWPINEESVGNAVERMKQTRFVPRGGK